MKIVRNSLMKVALIASFFMVAGLFANKAMADDTPETVNFTLHKLAFDKDNMPASTQNDGTEKNPFGTNSGTPLPGSGFTMYDVTQEFSSRLMTTTTTDSASAESIVKQLQAAFSEQIQKNQPYPTYAEKIGEERYVDNATGKVQFINIPTKKTFQLNSKTVTKDAVYVFVETHSSAAIDSTKGEKAVPMVVTLPVYLPQSNTMNKDIHLYPKNELTNVNRKEKLTNGITFDKQAPIQYATHFQVPTVAQDKLEIHDAVTPKNALALTNEPIKVINEDTKAEIPTDWYELQTPTTDKNVLNPSDIFVVKFKKEHIAELIGRTIRVEYLVKITASAPIDSPIQNIAYLVVDGHDKPVDPNDPTKPYSPTDPTNPFFPNDPTIPYDPFHPNDPSNPPVYTGGYKFIKKDVNSEKALAGAKFVVTNGNKDELKYAQFDEKFNFTGWITDGNKATTLTSSKDGTFEVKGLNSGEYQLKETKAPEGYALPADTFAFKVVTGTAGKTYLDGETAPAYTVNNVKKGLLPSTGSKGIYAFVAIGIVFFGAAFVFYKRANKQSEV